jgi:hypothetical protein
MEAVIGGAASLAGSMMSADAQRDAAAAQRAAAAAQERIAAENRALQEKMYNENVVRVQPWTTAGQNALASLGEQLPSITSKYDMAKYQASPEYQNMLAAMDRDAKEQQAQASVSGMIGSGNLANQRQINAAYIANQGYQQGLQNYWGQNQSIYNMLNQQSQMGLNAAGTQGVSGQNYANAVTNIGTNLGNQLGTVATNQGNAYTNMGNAYTNMGNTVSSLMSSIGKYNAQQNQANQPTTWGQVSNAFSGAGDWLSNLWGGGNQGGYTSPTTDYSNLNSLMAPQGAALANYGVGGGNIGSLLYGGW